MHISTDGSEQQHQQIFQQIQSWSVDGDLQLADVIQSGTVCSIHYHSQQKGTASTQAGKAGMET